MRNAHVLIVEDDEHWIETFTLVLAGKVARITSAATVDEAIGLLDQRYFNVAIVDLRLNPHSSPDETGMRFLRAVHERGLGAVIAPIMCTGYGSLNNAIEALRDFNVVDFVPKQEFGEQRLIDAVIKAVSASAAGSSSNRAWASASWQAPAAKLEARGVLATPAGGV